MQFRPASASFKSASAVTAQWLSCGHSLFVDSRSWSGVEPALAQQRTLVLIDGPGHGGSQPARRHFTLVDCAAAAAEVLDQLELTVPESGHRRAA